ncbi:hypothetical protein PAN31117_02610 [Pandoraea anapnoica]|uniref:Uncharacterized protein n=1 Tax=Pandoraea anapnoica TaxID=2508301 RepID=A0A5E5A1J4_9BURK|nr:hypothetical protein PAN31117_02610 [Pandoraea anapnoica]
MRAFRCACGKAFITFAEGIPQAPEIRGSALLAAIGRCIRLAKKSLDDA